MSTATAPTDAVSRATTPFDALPLWFAILAGALGGAATLALPASIAPAALAAPFAAAAAIDARTRRIPNALSAATLALGIAAAIPAGQGIEAVLGSLAALAAGVALYAGARGAFGLGDVKLMAGAGAVVGLARVFDFLLAMAFAGGAIALLLLAMHRGRRATMPYGPAIAAGVVLVLLSMR